MTKALETINPAELDRWLISDPETGKIYWRSRTAGDFTAPSRRSPQHQCAVFNSRHAGKEACAEWSPDGYRRGKVSGRNYMAHRVIWAMAHGEWPDQIDHINGDRSDNRLRNLRNVTAAENARNAAIRKDNKSGVSGIHYRKSTGRWLVTIGQKHVGSFCSIVDARAAKKAAERERGFHDNHGRPALESLSALKQRAEAIRKARAA